jgi:hypothetical protein
MPKRPIVALTLAAAIVSSLAACGSGDTISASSIGKCAHARPQTLSASAPVERAIVGKVVSGGWLFQSAGEESEAEREANTPGFDIYVFDSNKAAEEAFAMIEGAEHASEEFGGGGTYVAKNIVITSDQDAASLDSTADALLKKCAGISPTHSIHRPSSSESSAENSSSEAPASQGGEVGAPSEDQPSAGQSPVPTSTE